MKRLPQRVKFIYSLKFKIITGVVVLILGSIGYYINSRIDIYKERKLNEMKTPEMRQAPPNILFKAVIDDPDGYTNVRNEPTKQSPIVNQLYKGQIFDVIEIVGRWYKVECPNKIKGYVFHDRVQKIN
ncbi:MAG: SH3 domain-containing protein [Bacteroidota bacterium]